MNALAFLSVSSKAATDSLNFAMVKSLVREPLRLISSAYPASRSA